MSNEPALSTQHIVNIEQGERPSFPGLNNLAQWVQLFETQIAEMQAELADAASWTPAGNPNALDTRNSVTTGGTSTAYTVTFTDSYDSLVHGINLFVTPHVTCGDNPTLQLDSLAAKNIKKDGSNLASGAFVVDRTYLLFFSSVSDAWEVLSADATPAATTSVPAGAKMGHWAASPSGWTIDTAADDRVPLITDTAGEIGDNGGSWTVSGLSVLGHSLTTAENGTHGHTENKPADQVLRGAGALATGGAPTSGNTGSSGSGSAHTHGISSAGSWRPAYRKFAIYTKD